MPRATTVAGRLAALGFADTARAERLLTGDLGLDVVGQDAEVVSALAAAPDPDLALTGLARLARDEQLGAELRADPQFRVRLFAVLGTSVALAEHLRRHSADWRLLAGPQADLAPAADEVSAELLAAVSADQSGHPAAALRIGYRRRLLRLAARDLTGVATLDQ